MPDEKGNLTFFESVRSSLLAAPTLEVVVCVVGGGAQQVAWRYRSLRGVHSLERVLRVTTFVTVVWAAVDLVIDINSAVSRQSCEFRLLQV